MTDSQDDSKSEVFTDPGTSVSQAGSPSVTSSTIPVWEGFSPGQLYVGHTPELAYELLLKAATTAELTDDESDALDHYLGIPGIETWVKRVTAMKKKEAEELKRQRDEALQMKKQQQELDRKLKAGRLATIRTTVTSASPTSKPTGGLPKPTAAPKVPPPPLPFQAPPSSAFECPKRRSPIHRVDLRTP